MKKTLLMNMVVNQRRQKYEGAWVIGHDRRDHHRAHVGVGREEQDQPAGDPGSELIARGQALHQRHRDGRDGEAESHVEEGNHDQEIGREAQQTGR